MGQLTDADLSPRARGVMKGVEGRVDEAQQGGCAGCHNIQAHSKALICQHILAPSLQRWALDQPCSPNSLLSAHNVLAAICHRQACLQILYAYLKGQALHQPCLQENIGIRSDPLF